MSLPAHLRAASLALAFSLTAQAQQSPPAPSGTTPSGTINNQNMDVVSGENFFESDTARAFGKDLFDTEQDSVDLEEGVLHWKGKTFSLGNNRVVRARFERYLATPTYASGGDEYAATLDRILELLAVENTGNADAVDEAWNLLFNAGRHPIDAGNSLIIANQVYNAWRVRAENQEGRIGRNELERLRRYQQSIVSNRTWLEQKRAEDIARRHSGEARNSRAANRPDPAEYPDSGGGSSSSQERNSEGELSVNNEGINVSGGGSNATSSEVAPYVTAAAGTSQAAFDVARLAHLEAQIQALSASMAANAIQAKLQFQSQFVMFLKQRRYQHALITAAFYRHIFGGAHQRMEVARSQLADFVNIADIVPTIDLFEGIAREAIADTAVGMESVDNLYETGERYGALQRLQETYFLGEYLPRVIEYDPAKKRVLLELFQKVRTLQRVLDIKDYDSAESLVSAIRELADDFPYEQVVSVINTARHGSNIAVISAQGFQEIGEPEKAEVKIKEALELWPLNPKIETFLSNSVAQADFGNQASAKFDEAYAAGAYRLIQKEATRYGIALGQDPERAEKVEEVVTLMTQIDGMIAQAERLARTGFEYNAFELLLEAENLRPNDPRVATAISRLSRKVPRYAAILHDAREAEEEGRYATALNLYLAGRAINPTTDTCKAGIERLSGKLIDALENEKASDPASPLDKNPLLPAQASAES